MNSEIKWKIQVFLAKSTGDVREKKAGVWRDVSPTGGPPYRFSTKLDADQCAEICYPDLDPSLFRVVMDMEFYIIEKQEEIAGVYLKVIGVPTGSDPLEGLDDGWKVYQGPFSSRQDAVDGFDIFD